MTFNDFAFFIALIVIAGFIYLTINGVYRTINQKKYRVIKHPMADGKKILKKLNNKENVNVPTGDMNLNGLVNIPITETETFKLPKQAPRNSHWHKHTFERPRKKVR